MASRLKLHEELCAILGNRNVYYKPPESVKMKYPFIRYSKSGVSQLKADDKQYRATNQYEIVVIDHNPDSDIHEKILSTFSMCNYNRGYVADNLYHTNLTLYY